MKKNIEEIINETAINKLKRSTPKKNNDKQRNELKRNILNMSIDLLKEKKINKTAYIYLFSNRYQTKCICFLLNNKF